MKIALVWHGQMREFDKCYLTWKTFIDTHDVDIFMHTWAPVLISLPLTKATLIEHQLDFTDYKQGVTEYGSSALNVLPQMYSIYQSNKLRRDYEDFYNFKYDWIVRSRFDIQLHNPRIDFSKLNPAFNHVANNHWTHHTEMYDDNIMISGRGNDHFEGRLFTAATTYIQTRRLIPSGEQLLSNYINENKNWLPHVYKNPALDFTLGRML